METLVSRDPTHPFRAPKRSLGNLDAEVVARLISTAADVALIVDREGIIRDVAFASDDLAKNVYGSWIGQPFAETVTIESRPKVEELLKDALKKTAPRWRQVNHPASEGADVPIRYAAVDAGRDGKVIAVGRDLRAIAALQQRLVQAQQSMEREYARLRHAETRYRLLFQIASEAVLIVDAGSSRIVEANPAASQVLGKASRRLQGRTFPDLFEDGSAAAVQALLTTVRTAGRGDDVRARLGQGGREFLVSATLFRQDNASHFLVRLVPPDAEAATGVPRTKSRLLKVVENLPDGFVVTDPAQRILTANSAFLEMAQLPTEEQARGETLARWIGRSEVDVNVLIANLKEHGSVRNFATVLRGEYGSSEDVEISAVSVLNGEQPCFGLTIRNVGRRLPIAPRSGTELPRSVEQLTELVGRVSLKDLVRETTDMIERLCIEAALELTGDNRASAAEMLGLSRQSLYVKLRRYGLGDLEAEDE